jgi:hypothetical protein
MLYGFLAGGVSANVRQNTPIVVPLVVKWWSNPPASRAFSEPTRKGSSNWSKVAYVEETLFPLLALGACLCEYDS